MASTALSLAQSEEYVGNGRNDHYWSWSIWLEGPAAELDRIDYVEYTLHHTFPKPVRRVKNRRTKFKLESAGWGVFTIYAKAVTKEEGREINLQHDLELHFPSGKPNLA